MKRSLALMALTLVALAFLAHGADEVNARLQKGLFEEEANHNLDAAIAAYQSILTAHDEERKLAATALFRLGECYRKLGRTNDAAAQYRRLLTDFPEQATLIRLSEQNLFALGVPRETSLNAGNGASAASPRERPLIQEQIALAERQLAEAKGRIKVGTAPTNADLPYRQELARLHFELAATEEPPGGPQQRKWLDESIALQEGAVAEAKRLIQIGLAATSSEIQPQKELLALKRQRAALEDAGKSAPGPKADVAPAPSQQRVEEAAEIQRLEKMLADSPDLLNASSSSQNPLLHQAVQEGKLQVATFLLDHGADVNVLGPGGDSALLIAVNNGKRSMVELLLDRHADTSIRTRSENGATPLLLASRKGFKSIVELLLAHGADLAARDWAQQTALHLAARSNNKEVAEVLLANKAEVDAVGNFGTPLCAAVADGRPGMVQLLAKHGAKVDARLPDGSTALSSAIRRNDEGMVDVLLALGADPNLAYDTKRRRIVPDNPPAPDQYTDAAQFTPLMTAAYDGLVSIGQKLLKAGAQINALDGNGASALLWAVRRRQQAMTEQLLAAGADPNAQDKWSGTPLGTAAERGHVELVRDLLDKGADVNRSSGYDQTPLMKAVASGNRPTAELLLERGADLSMTDFEGRTALDLARVYHRELVPLLREHGASEYVPRPGLITLCRIRREYSTPIFFKDTNGYNHHTIVEFLARSYAGNGALTSTELRFPDLQHVRLTRRDPAGGKLRETNVDLAAILESKERVRDLPLAWGDVIEIPEVDHREAENWGGFSETEIANLESILTRRVKVVVKGETTSVTIKPPRLASAHPGPMGMVFGGVGVAGSPPRAVPASPSPTPQPAAPGLPGGFPGAAPVRAVPAPPPPPPELTVGSFRLLEVLGAANVLRVSSDLSRVKVTRTDPATKQPREMLFDFSSRYGNYDARRDLWLEDGDLIEVPDK